MMQLKRKSLLLIIIFGLSFFVTSCCDCFDGDEDALLFYIDEEAYDDSIYYISTEQGNLNNHNDTFNLWSEVIWIDGRSQNDWIIKCDSPNFEHHITDIKLKGKTGLPPCSCYSNKNIDFKYDGIDKNKSDLAIIVKK